MSRYKKQPMKKVKPKFAVIVSCLLLLAMVSTTIVYTLAYRTNVTETVVNTFDPVDVEIKIDEKFDGEVKEDVGITNTGDIEVYIRFKISVSAIDEDGNIISLPISLINTSDTVADLTQRAIDICDFTITNNDDGDPADWTDSFIEIDGIYYYSSLVAVDETVSIFDSATFNVPIFDPAVLDLPFPLIDDDGDPYYVFNSDGDLCYQTDTNDNYVAYDLDGEDAGAGYTSLLDEDGTFTYMLSSYTPVITIVAESVQANGVVEAWGVTLDSDGKITTTAVANTVLTIEDESDNTENADNPVVIIENK